MRRLTIEAGGRGMRRLVIFVLMVGTTGCAGAGVASPGEPGASSPTVSEATSIPPPATYAPAAHAPATSSPATPLPATSPPDSSPRAAGETAVQDDSRFRLTFTLPRTTWRAEETIEGEAVLALIDGDQAELGVAGNGPLEFIFQEVDGRREMGPAWDTVCASAQLAADAPITWQIRKSGGYGEGDPDLDFYRSFFADPLVRLPAGDWDITAVAEFIDGRDCRSEDHHSMRATVRVHVTE